MVLDNFITEIQQYCKLIEEIDNVALDKFLKQLSICLPLIYSYGKQLPKVAIKNEKVSNNRVKFYYNEISKKLGDIDEYHKVFDPLIGHESVQTTLSDDLSDIYCSLKNTLIEFQNLEDKDSAIWEWKFEIEGHTGDHVVDALKVIHRLTNPYYM